MLPGESTQDSKRTAIVILCDHMQNPRFLRPRCWRYVAWLVMLFVTHTLSFRRDQRWISKKDVPRLLKQYRSDAKLDRKNFTAMILFGEVLMKDNQFRKARSAFMRARKLRPRHPRLFENLAELACRWEEEYGEALPGPHNTSFDYYHIPLALNPEPHRREGRAFWPLAERPAEDGAVGDRPKTFGIERSLSPAQLENLPATEITLGGGRDGFLEFASSEIFENNYWEKSPLLIHAPRALENMLSLDDVLDDPLGYQYRGEKRKPPHRNVKYMKKHFTGVEDQSIGTQQRGELVHALQNGYTLQFLGVHMWMKKLARFGIDLSRATTRTSSINLYITPPSVETSLSPHTDFQDSFMVQLQGRKRWRLWKFPDLELPTRFRHIKGRDPGDEIDVDILGKPLLDIVLNPGDVLFVPRGCLHTTSTPPPLTSSQKTKKISSSTPVSEEIVLKQASMHLTVGVEVMSDETTCFQWQAFFGSGAFFRHDHVVEGFYTALGQLVDHDKRFRKGVPTAMLYQENDDLVESSNSSGWKKMAKTLMHAIVDEMFEHTDFAETTQTYFKHNLMKTNIDTYRRAFPLKKTPKKEKRHFFDL